MQPEQQSHNTPLAQRIHHLNKIIADEKYQIYQKTKRLYDNILSCKKYKDHKEEMRERIIKSDKFIKEVSQTFFTMLTDQEFLAITTEVDLIDKIQKFKKNLYNSLQKITIIDERKINLDKKNQESKEKNSQSEQFQQNIPQKKRMYRKSKNSKMSSQTSMVMMQWLLRNFQNPYPTTLQKQKMSKESKLTVIQVNNWFINARERTIKSYFIKQQ